MTIATILGLGLGTIIALKTIDVAGSVLEKQHFRQRPFRMKPLNIKPLRLQQFSRSKRIF